MFSEACLTSMAIEWKSDHSYTYFDHFALLRTLPLSIFQPHPQGFLGHLGTLGSYASCFVYDSNKSSLFSCLDGFDFPNLRVVNMQDMLIHPYEVYQFVARHPSLR